MLLSTGRGPRNTSRHLLAIQMLLNYSSGCTLEYATTCPIPWEMAQITKRHHDTGLFLHGEYMVPAHRRAGASTAGNINTKAGEVHDGSRCFVVVATLPPLLCMFWCQLGYSVLSTGFEPGT